MLGTDRRAQDRRELISASVHDLPLPEKSFDFVLSLDVLSSVAWMNHSPSMKPIACFVPEAD